MGDVERKDQETGTTLWTSPWPGSWFVSAWTKTMHLHQQARALSRRLRMGNWNAFRVCADTFPELPAFLTAVTGCQ